jgi:hypothetical protein
MIEKDMNTNKIKLYYLTNMGSPWLEKEVEVTPQNYQGVVFYYVEENGPVAERLVRKWRIDGNDGIDMYLEVDNISCDTLLYREIVNLIEEQY